MKALSVSGHTEDSMMHQGVLERGIAFPPKPITPTVSGAQGASDARLPA